MEDNKIVNSEEYKDLKCKEEKMLENEDSFKLLNYYQEIQSKYNEAKRFEKYGSNLESVSKELSEVKGKVYDNYIIKDYNLAYKKMVKQLKIIEKIIFKDVIKERKEISLE